MTLNYPQTQQPHETRFLLCYIKTYKARTESMQKIFWVMDSMSVYLCAQFTLGQA